MPYGLQNSINYAGSFIQYAPLNVGTGGEPANSIATGVRNTILNAPFMWPWNRAEFSIALVAGQQDYTFSITDFAYLEKVSLLSADGTYGYEIKDVYNTNSLGIPSTAVGARAQPNGVSVRSYIPGTSVSLRFLSNPDQAYTGIVTYQQLVLPFNYLFSVTSASNADGNGNTTYTGTFNPSYFPPGSEASIFRFITNVNNNGVYLVISCTSSNLVVANANGIAETVPAVASNTGSWAPIPDSFIDIYNALFLAEAFAFVDDARSQQYRQRGVAALLSKAEGLSDMQVSAFLSQFEARSRQGLSSQLRAQQAQQARGT
jgi:hypothetical protein